MVRMSVSICSFYSGHAIQIYSRRIQTEKTRSQKKTHQSTSRVLIACIFMFVKLFMEYGGCVRTRDHRDGASFSLWFLFRFGASSPVSILTV